MKPAVAYCRTSTGKQENSLEAQQSTLRAMAALRDTKLIEVVVDADEFSGNLQRPGVQRVLDMVRRKQVSAVLITRLDRLTRSTRDAIDLMELFAKSGVALVSHYESLDTESPIGKFVVRLMASIGELEREMIGSRTKAGLANIKEQGFPVGTAPYGWQAQPRTAEEKRDKVRRPLLPSPAEQEVIAQVVEWRNAGFGLAEIAALLHAAGSRTRRGGQWSHQGVANILNASEATQVEVRGE